MKKYLLLSSLILSYSLGSCRSVVPASETAPPDANSTFPPTQTAKPKTTATVPPVASATLLPTQVTIKPSATSTIVGTIIAMSEPRINSTHLSPDGKWQAEVLIYDCVPVNAVDENAYEQLKIIQTSDESTEIAADQLQFCGGLGAFGLDGLFWSPNSRYFYYTTGREGYPDGCGYWEPPIIRLDINTFEKESLGSGSLSKDGTRLATRIDHELLVWDTNDGEIARIPAIDPGMELGPVAWSPDGQALVYIQVESFCPISGRSYVVRVDVPEHRQTVLLESEAPSFGNVFWDIGNELRLRDESGGEWRYDFTTHELQQLP